MISNSRSFHSSLFFLFISFARLRLDRSASLARSLAFTEAILVTPLGALSVVICAILSTFILKEKLTFFGWIGCVLCIMGATILALNAPETQSVHTIPVFQKLFLSPGFLTWAGVCIAVSLFLAFWAAPRYGKKNMFVYIGICSLIGGLSVSTLQGLGAAIVTSIRGNNQFKVSERGRCLFAVFRISRRLRQSSRAEFLAYI